MYLEYFGFERPPFNITPDVDLFYSGAHRGDVLNALIYAIQQGDGIIKVVGEVGSGKTTLCRMLETQLPESVHTVFLANPSLSAKEIPFAIALEMGLELKQNRFEMLHDLQTYLLNLHTEGKQIVVFIEEAQKMALDTLEELRLLSNLETHQHKLLQMVLFGQPELDDNLKQPHIRQLKERIIHNFTLEPLKTAEIGLYINHRIQCTRFNGSPLFSKKAIQSISGYSQGLSRRINLLADKCLLAAYSYGDTTVTPKHVAAAAREFGFSKLNVRTLVANKQWFIFAVGLLFIISSIVLLKILAVA